MSMLTPKVRILDFKLDNDLTDFETQVEHYATIIKNDVNCVPESFKVTWLAEDGWLICILEWCEHANNLHP